MLMVVLLKLAKTVLPKLEEVKAKEHPALVPFAYRAAMSVK